MSSKDLFAQDTLSLKQNFLNTLTAVNSVAPYVFGSEVGLVGNVGLSILNNNQNISMDYQDGQPLNILNTNVNTKEEKPLQFALPQTKWGGPLYSAGRFFKQDEIITIQDIIENPALNKADKLYMLHDVEYQYAATRNSLLQRVQALKDADREYIKRAQELLKDKSLSLVEKGLLNSSILAFKAKLKSGYGYESAVKKQITDPRAYEAYNYFFNNREPGRSRNIEINRNRQQNPTLDFQLQNTIEGIPFIDELDIIDNDFY